MNIPLRAYGSLLWIYLKPQWRKVVLLGALLSGSIALQLLNPQLLRSFIDQASAGAERGALLRTAGLFMGVALLNQLLSAYARYVGEDVGWAATNGLREDLANHCIRLDLGVHKSRTPGEWIERIDGDVNALSNFFSQFVIDVASNGVLLVGVLVLLYQEDWRVGLGMTAFAAVALYVLMKIRAHAVGPQTASRAAMAGLFGLLGERLAGTEDIRSSGAVSYVMNRFYRQLREMLPLYRRANMWGASMWWASMAIFALGNAVAMSMGAYLWMGGAISLGSVYLLINYTELLRRPIERIRTQLQDLQRAGASIHRVEELFRTPSRIADGPGAPIEPGPLAVSFRDVSFAYEGDERVLHSLTFDLRPGTVVGLLGRTGSGKTTLARLLLRFYDVTEGEIRLGGTEIRQARLADLRRRVGLVTQNVELFNASVRDNLTFFDRTVSDERISAVLEELGMGPWLRSLPAGLDTELAAGGGGLSAGEAQLLALTRIFLADPGLIILDEASSRLDPATEQLLERAVSRLLQGRTAIIIAHRLATVQRADEILILDGGRLVEHGVRERLANDPTTRFHRVLKTGMEELLA